MNYSNPINSIAYAVAHATLIGVHPIFHGDGKERRPSAQELQSVELWQQTFSDTSLMFGGMAGQAISTADVTIVFGPCGDVCVYCNGRFAYHIQKPNDKFRQDYSKKALVGVDRSFMYEGK